MKKIMIDMDEVICGNGFIVMINEFLNSNFKETDAKDYFLQDLVPESKRKEFFDWFMTKNLYEYAVLKRDAVEVIKKLNDKYDVYICTAYVWREVPSFSGNILKYKFDYLIKYLPFLDPNKYCFLTNKDIFDCDIKIDDKMDNLTNAKTKLLYNAYHNDTISKSKLEKEGVIRVNSWKEIEKILL